MKCPKCAGTLLVISTPNGSFEGKAYIDINLECSEDEQHFYFARVQEEDLIDGM